MTGTLDLFDMPVLPGLATTAELVSVAEARALVAAIDAAELTPYRFQGWTGKRLTASYGWHYDADAGCVRQGEPLPHWLLPFRDRAAEFADGRAFPVCA